MLLISRKDKPEDILRVIQTEVPTKAARIAAVLLTGRNQPHHGCGDQLRSAAAGSSWRSESGVVIAPVWK
jgi:hypothetical protein